MAAVGGTGMMTRKGVTEDRTSYATASHGGLLSPHACHALKHGAAENYFLALP